MRLEMRGKASLLLLLTLALLSAEAAGRPSRMSAGGGAEDPLEEAGETWPVRAGKGRQRQLVSEAVKAALGHRFQRMRKWWPVKYWEIPAEQIEV
ncbi:hypothetical protein BOX15_Mlig028598g1 [Macrostomum lignano]|uniref:Uncharacterized protein n=1 Tax=Macrostomum lignano TaxID=282301 RepID=A0A267E8D9_9PLAT|nr:hypothetical protein BOX15_Mlig028598g1 [Macrostomum lignano]